MDLCLRVLKESNKSRFDSYSVRNSVLIISHITFRDCRVHTFFWQPFSKQLYTVLSTCNMKPSVSCESRKKILPESHALFLSSNGNLSYMNKLSCCCSSSEALLVSVACLMKYWCWPFSFCQHLWGLPLEVMAQITNKFFFSPSNSTTWGEITGTYLGVIFARHAPAISFCILSRSSPGKPTILGGLSLFSWTPMMIYPPPLL